MNGWLVMAINQAALIFNVGAVVAHYSSTGRIQWVNLAAGLLSLAAVGWTARIFRVEGEVQAWAEAEQKLRDLRIEISSASSTFARRTILLTDERNQKGHN